MLSHAIDRIQILTKFVIPQLHHINLRPIQLNPNCTYVLRKIFPTFILDRVYNEGMIKSLSKYSTIYFTF